MGNIIKTFGFSTESVTGFGKKGPNGPDYNSILALLGLNEINYTSDNDFFYQIKSYMNVLHPFYGIHPLPGTSLILDNMISSDSCLKYKNTLYNIDNLSKKIDSHNESFEKYDSSKDYTNWWLFLKEYTGCFPDIFWYINSWGAEHSIKDILPKDFLLIKHNMLHLYMVEYNTLIQAKLWYESEYLRGDKLEEYINEYKKSFDFWQNRQIMYFIGPYISEINDFTGTSKINNLNYIPNHLQKDIVYDEILENILFISLQILELEWTINYCKSNFSIEYIKNLMAKQENIKFYNLLYSELKKGVELKYYKEYNIFKELWEQRYLKYGFKKAFLSYYHLLKINTKGTDITLNEYTYDLKPKSIKDKYSEIYKSIKNKPKYKHKVNIKLKVKFKYKMFKYKSLKYKNNLN